MNAGEYGDDLAALVIQDIEGQPDETSKQIVYSRVLRALQMYRLHRAPETKPEPAKSMTEVEARRFEQSPCPFGRHRGVLNWAIPIEYLCHLTDPSPYIQDVRRYLLSERGKKRIEEGR